jgi:hypothetical protein
MAEMQGKKRTKTVYDLDVKEAVVDEAERPTIAAAVAGPRGLSVAKLRARLPAQWDEQLE